MPVLTVLFCILLCTVWCAGRQFSQSCSVFCCVLCGVQVASSHSPVLYFAVYCVVCRSPVLTVLFCILLCTVWCADRQFSQSYSIFCCVLCGVQVASSHSPVLYFAVYCVVCRSPVLTILFYNYFLCTVWCADRQFSQSCSIFYCVLCGVQVASSTRTGTWSSGGMTWSSHASRSVPSASSTNTATTPCPRSTFR